ncbi:hypothetical protein E2C01_025183 [Portunus trituberculatus]|uniref:Uncharacterized protein n=1 Tax=Portunus trituberculatus TaxID=210409 RepID=A0A5B7EFU9_PORTR|nr:hypothetical protein [Portunus trituberculatus]
MPKTTPDATEHFLLQCPRFLSQHIALHSRLSALAIIITLDMPTHSPCGLRRPPLLATYCPSPYLFLLEEDRPATMPVIPAQDYPRAHKDP